MVHNTYILGYTLMAFIVLFKLCIFSPRASLVFQIFRFLLSATFCGQSISMYSILIFSWQNLQGGGFSFANKYPCVKRVWPSRNLEILTCSLRFGGNGKILFIVGLFSVGFVPFVLPSFVDTFFRNTLNRIMCGCHMFPR